MNYHKKTRHLVPVYKVEGLTYKEARGLEEMGMLLCHTLRKEYPFNIIHGISINNPNRAIYLYNAVKYLENKAENELLNILDGGL